MAAFAAPAHPRIGRCQACGAGVLFVQARGGELALEPVELLPRMRCPSCKGPRCRRCGGARWIGERYPRRGRVILREDGWARTCPDDRQLDRYDGESVHIVHRCG